MIAELKATHYNLANLSLLYIVYTTQKLKYAASNAHCTGHKVIPAF